MTADPVQPDIFRSVADVATQLRAVLTEIEAGRLTCTPAAHRRIEGAVIALRCVASGGA